MSDFLHAFTLENLRAIISGLEKMPYQQGLFLTLIGMGKVFLLLSLLAIILWALRVAFPQKVMKRLQPVFQPGLDVIQPVLQPGLDHVVRPVLKAVGEERRPTHSAYHFINAALLHHYRHHRIGAQINLHRTVDSDWRR